MRKLRVLDLFSGIGAYALGVERAGMQVVAFCEIEEFPRKILRKHWPDVPIYEDVRTLTADTLRRDGIAVDVIVGGWPCQDISVAGTRVGLDGERSGLWSEVARLAGELRPSLLILENSSNLLASSPDGEPPGRDFGRVLGDLAALGYDAEWHCLPAAAFDAPHIRDRLWIVAIADANDDRLRQQPGRLSRSHRPREAVSANDGAPQSVANAVRLRRKERGDASSDRARREAKARKTKGGAIISDDRSGDALVADTNASGLAQRTRLGSDTHSFNGQAVERVCGEGGNALAHANSLPSIGAAVARRERHTWDAEPNVARVAPRSAVAVDRIRALGNCNPPIIIETIARAILAAQTQSEPTP